MTQDEYIAILKAKVIKSIQESEAEPDYTPVILNWAAMAAVAKPYARDAQAVKRDGKLLDIDAVRLKAACVEAVDAFPVPGDMEGKSRVIDILKSNWSEIFKDIKIRDYYMVVEE